MSALWLGGGGGTWVPRRCDCLDLRESSAAALREETGSSDMAEESSAGVIWSRDHMSAKLSPSSLVNVANFIFYGWWDIAFERNTEIFAHSSLRIDTGWEDIGLD